MNHDPSDDRPGTGSERRRLEEFFKDELRLAAAEAPSFDDLAAYVEGRLDTEERRALEDRMADDPALQREVEDLRELHHQMRRPRVTSIRTRRPWAVAGLAAAATMAALVLWLRSPVERRRGDDKPVTPTAPPIASLKDGDERVALAADGTLSGLPALDPGLRDAVKGTLRGVLPRPAGLDALQTGRSTLMGPDTGAPAFRLLAPRATRVASDRPTFRWTPHPEGRAYEVAVFDQDLRKRAASGPVTGTEWTPDRSLARGGTYLWQVSTQTRSGRVTVPAPPAPEARFEVASPEVLAEVARRRAVAPASHLVAVTVLIETGLLDDAEAELQALYAENPGSPEVARVSQALRDLRRAR